MLVEIDLIAVDHDLMEQVRTGDATALRTLRKKLHGINLYNHALSTFPNDELVALRELNQRLVIDEVTVTNFDMEPT